MDVITLIIYPIQDAIYNEQARKDREEGILKEQAEAARRAKEAKQTQAFQDAQYVRTVTHLIIHQLLPYYYCSKVNLVFARSYSRTRYSVYLL